MLANQSSPGVKVKIWGTEAENLDCSSKPVLVIKDIKVRSSQDSSTAEYLSTCTSTFMQTDPDMEVAQNLRKWYKGKYARTKTISRVEGTVARSRATMPTVNHELQDVSMSNNEQASPKNSHRIQSEPSDEIRRIIDNAVKNGAVEMQVGKCVLLGPPEAGKTQLKGALLEEFAEVQESTPASTQATPVIQLLVAGSTKWEHFNFRHMRTFSTRKNLYKKSLDNSKTNTTHPREDTGMQFCPKKSDREPAAVRSPGSNVLNSPQSHPKSAKMRAKSKSNWEIFRSLREAVMHKLLKEGGTSTTDNLEAIRLIYVVDSGGQPSFIDFHSVTATFPASYMLVYNMEQGLDWKPPYTLRKIFDTKVLPNDTQSNADMIYRSLLTVHHLKSKFSDRNKQIKTLLEKNFCPCAEPPVFIVGTHKDQVLKVSERSQMEDDEERLKHLYQNIPSMRQVMHTQFVDSLSEGCEGIKELRETMSDRGSLCSFRLPLSWFHLHLMAMSLESEEMPNRTLQVQSYGDLCKMCMRSELVKSEEEFKAMIMVLHSLGVFSCPDFELCEGTDDSMGKETIIFLSPSLLYGYVSVILEIPFRNLDRTMHKPSLLRLQGAGELTVATLTELEIPRNLGSCKDFHNSLLKWLVNWGLAAKMDAEERYFIPSVLPPKADLKQPVCGAKWIDPFPLYICFVEECSNNFTFHYLPDGIFPHFIVNLLKAGYVLPQNNPDTASTDNCPRCRNAILLIRSRRQFKCRNTFNVQLSDENDRLSVNIYPADASVPSDTVLKEAGEVLSELKQIMQETNLNSNRASIDELRLCSRCPCFETDSEEGLANSHLSLIDRVGNSTYVMSCLHSKRLEIGAWERQNSSKSTNHVLQGFYTSQDSHVGSGDCEEPCEPPMISAQLGNSHSNVQHLANNEQICKKRSSKSIRGHSQSSYYEDCSDNDEERGKGTKSKRFHSDPKQSHLQNEPNTGPDLAINSTTDLAPYLDKMKTQLKLLGCVLGIQNETAAIEKTSEDSTTKCLQILEHWLKVTTNPSWSLLCTKLKVSDSFNNVRELIEKDHFQ